MNFYLSAYKISFWGPAENQHEKIQLKAYFLKKVVTA